MQVSGADSAAGNGARNIAHSDAPWATRGGYLAAKQSCRALYSDALEVAKAANGGGGAQIHLTLCGTYTV